MTAGRVRGRVEQVLGWCTVRGHRSGDNPARWRGHLDQALPTRGEARLGLTAGPKRSSNISKRCHTAKCLHLWRRLRSREGVAAQALAFLVLTGARSDEVLGARWSEVDLDAAIWVVPPERMKARKEHRVPLSPAAVELLRGCYREPGNPHCFIGPRSSSLSPAALSATLHRMNIAGTAHGMRSAFRDWCADRTNFPDAVVELIWQHEIGSKVEKAYKRSDLIARRAKLMEAWATFCTTASAKAATVVSLRGTGR